MSFIEPINDDARIEVVAATSEYLKQARELLSTQFEDIPVLFDLRGRAAGMYRVNRGARVIRYNPYIFAKYYAENLATTIPHEVAHYLTDVVYGGRNVRPHGHEWRSFMRMFGADDTVRCDFDLTGIPVRQYRRVRYICRCRSHELTKVRHNRIERHGARYYCRYCCSQLVLATP